MSSALASTHYATGPVPDYGTHVPESILPVPYYTVVSITVLPVAVVWYLPTVQYYHIIRYSTVRVRADGYSTVPSAMEFLDMEKFTSIVALFFTAP